jgi:hypothetical protein
MRVMNQIWSCPSFWTSFRKRVLCKERIPAATILRSARRPPKHSKSWNNC